MSTETTEIVSKIDVKKSRKSNMHDGGIILPPTDIAPHKQTDSRAQTPELLQVGSAADPRSSHTTAKKSKRHKVEDTEKHAIASSQIPEDVEVTKPKKKKRKHVDVEESTSVREEEVNLTGTDKDRKKKKKKKKRDLAEENLDNLASTDERQISRKSKKGQTSEGDGIIEDREINITEKRNKKRNKEKRHDRQVDDVQSPKKKKANKIDLPNPDDDKSITDQARKALAYAYAKFAEPDNWKFNKARQNWLIRNIWSEQIPEIYTPLLTRYLVNLQGGVRDHLITACKNILAPSTDTSVDPSSQIPADPLKPIPEEWKQLRSQVILNALV